MGNMNACKLVSKSRGLLTELPEGRQIRELDQLVN